MIIDHAVINELRSLVPGILDDVIATWLDDAPQRMAAIHAAADADDLHRATHTLKGSAAALGLNDLSDRCCVCCTSARNGDYAAAVAMIPAIDDAYQAAVQAISAERGS
ncbi:MAG: Hpt domain-containing protein [Planctomycetota bacterium]|jgi:HPt (histidine-containing phosphotransfer) domain-containing protein